MKEFLFIRHAKSSWSDISLRDFDRPLNKRGLRDAPFMAKLLAGKGIKPDAIVSSPANRAYTTATYFAEATGIKEKQIIKEEDIYEAAPVTVREILSDLDDELKTVLIFGHNPTFTDLANHYGGEYIPNVPTCGIVHFRSLAKSWEKVKPDNTERVGFYYPKEYFV